jgi:cold shock CspA family protein
MFDREIAAHIAALQGVLPKRLMPKHTKTRTKTMTEPKNESDRVTGVISFWHPQNEFGFAITDADDPGTFVGRNALAFSGIQSLKRGDKIEYRRAESRKKPGKFEARDIKLIEAAKAA